MLPFKNGDKVLEIGGGENPRFRPNVDIRAGNNVDFVADLSQGIPTESEAFTPTLSLFQPSSRYVPHPLYGSR